jgi:hypothetical protein
VSSADKTQYSTGIVSFNAYTSTNGANSTLVNSESITQEKKTHKLTIFHKLLFLLLLLLPTFRLCTVPRLFKDWVSTSSQLKLLVHLNLKEFKENLQLYVTQYTLAAYGTTNIKIFLLG